ncbi:Putative vitellogenin receptor, partial [Gryllus bimaculatus]
PPAGFSRCAAGQFQCANGTSREGLYCVAAAAACDSVADCSDGSDEAGCEERGCPGAFRCRSGRCLARALVCNGLPDCKDGSDEDACGSCGNEEFLCPEGWCAPLTLRCDGVRDCAGGEDEKLCECPVEQRACHAGGCVARERVCDGARDCPDGSDEWDCVRLHNSTRLLQVRRESGWAAVCSDGWDSTWSDAVCRGMGLAAGAVNERRAAAVGGGGAAGGAGGGRQRVGGRAPNAAAPAEGARADAGAGAPTCRADSRPRLLRRQQRPCGSHGVAYSARLVGGDGATSGQWPSVAQLVHARSRASCTATVVSPLWLLASLSCLRQRERQLSASEWAAMAGDAGGAGAPGGAAGASGEAGVARGVAQVREGGGPGAHPVRAARPAAS